MSLSPGGGPSGGGVGGSGGGNNGGGGPSSASFTHFNKHYNRNYTQSYMNATATTSSESIASNDGNGRPFTSVMRDRQARGKDPYHSGDGSEGSDLSDRESGATPSKLRLVGGGGGGGRPEKEDYARTELRQKAIAFLGSPELLMMYAQSTGDSIPGARLHFMRILCGYDEVPQHSSSSKASASTSRFANRPDHPRQHSHNSHNIGEKRRR
ncbi:hypothetical protein B0T21DRAFT_278189 [Apiosordaria backusii]|uniref:Uncharacterized protein n=1 Tax=Apiosordaria backusii TaxID=314023 RepID=A0AA40EYF6_9PEZI|nr:hypothetical protein B0T21DRAFT_278189 [Apiosordaria backusii]